MTREARIMSGIILITVPTIQYGGYFLLTSLLNKGSGYMENQYHSFIAETFPATISVFVCLKNIGVESRDIRLHINGCTFKCSRRRNRIHR
jgi:hypothetical protein